MSGGDWSASTRFAVGRRGPVRTGQDETTPSPGEAFTVTQGCTLSHSLPPSINRVAVSYKYLLVRVRVLGTSQIYRSEGKDPEVVVVVGLSLLVEHQAGRACVDERAALHEPAKDSTVRTRHRDCTELHCCWGVLAGWQPRSGRRPLAGAGQHTGAEWTTVKRMSVPSPVLWLDTSLRALSSSRGGAAGPPRAVAG